MNKKILTLSVVFTILVAIAIGGFLFWKSNQIANLNTKSKQTSMLINSNIKNDNELVWYEIPELDIKFKVTPDTKEDLGYDFKKYAMKSPSIDVSAVSFYSKVERKDKNCILSEDGYNCGQFSIVSIGKDSADKYELEINQRWCSDKNTIIFSNINSNNLYCLYASQKAMDKLFDNEEYLDYFHLPQLPENSFGVFFDSIEKK